MASREWAEKTFQELGYVLSFDLKPSGNAMFPLILLFQACFMCDIESRWEEYILYVQLVKLTTLLNTLQTESHISTRISTFEFGDLETV